MNTKFAFHSGLDQNMVYVREIAAEDLPQEVQQKIGKAETVFALHDATGQPLALARNRSEAFFLAKENDLAPVSLH